MTKKQDFSAENEFAKELQALRTAALEAFRRHATLRELPAERVLFRQGDQLCEVCLIERGFIKLTRTEINGDERPIQFWSSGRILGAAPALSGNPALLTATTLTRGELAVLSVESFRRQIRSNPALAEYLLGTLSRMFYEQVIRYSQSKSLSARARVAALLLQFLPVPSSGAAGELRLELPAQRQDLAKYLLLTPEHFSRLLREMEDEGIIRRQQGWIFVPSLERLAQAAGSSGQADHLT